MADDITLTVRVRDMTQGDFNRLDRQLDRMKRNLQGVSRATSSAGMHSKRLGQDIGTLQQKFQRLQSTGNLTRRELTQMRGVLDGMSRSALNAARSGEITQQKYNALNSEIQSLRTQFNYLGRDVSTANTQINDTNDSSHSLSGALNSLGDSAKKTGDNGSFAGGAFSNLRAKFIGAGLVLGATLLPTIGALAPMLAGLGAVAGVAALAFIGLDKPTKFLTKDQKDFLTALKPVTKEFGNLRKAAQDAVLPKMTKSFGDVRNMVKSLNPVIKIAGDTFGNLVGKIARGVASKDFMGPFTENVRMGTRWLEDFAKSFGTFSKEFFTFGTKSQPALDAWQNLLGGFLDRGLPGMFKGLEQGISGASDWLNGLAYFINDSLLPALGKLTGSFMETFGPFLEQMMIGAGDALRYLATAFEGAMEGMQPLVSFFTDGLRAMNQVAQIGADVFGDLAKVLGGALIGTIADLLGMDDPFAKMNEGFRGFSDWVSTHRGQIRQAFTDIAQGIISMVQASINMLPLMVGAFTTMTKLVITALDSIISGAAKAFGWIPGIGDDLIRANEDFDAWASGTMESLEKVERGVNDFVDAANPNLNRASLKLNVSQAEAALTDIKAQLDDPNLTKERKARLTAEKTRVEEALQAARIRLAEFDRQKASAKLDANTSAFNGKIGQANRVRLSPKSANVTANTDSFWGRIRALPQVLATRYINVLFNKVESSVQPKFSANGNIFRGKAFAGGGIEDHQAQIAPAGAMRVWAEPETGGEAYIPLSVTKRARSRQIAADTVSRLGGSVEWFAKGGMSQSTKDARKELTSSFGISGFGRMAGYQRTPFQRSLAVPGDVSSLVTNLNQTLSRIRRAFSGKTERTLTGTLTVAGRAMIRHQKNLDKVNSSLEKAKTKLDDLRQAAASLRESVSSGVMSATNITKVASGDKNVTMQDVMMQMRTNTDKATAFSGALSQLKSKGVSKTIIQQIAEAGIDGGGLETAGAILSASSSEISTLNDMQAKISSSAASAGKTAADAMYGAGIKAAEGLVAGLNARKKSIEKSMLDLAKYMEKALKRALGIKSPSKVTERIGEFTAEGFAVGMRKNRSTDSAWSSMLNVPASARNGGSGVGGGAQVIQLVVSGRVLDEIILDSNQRTVRTRGGNVQAVYGKR